MQTKQTHVHQRLCLMHSIKTLDAFQLHYDPSTNDEIGSMLADQPSLVHHRDADLPLKRKAVQIQFNAESFFIYTFK